MLSQAACGTTPGFDHCVLTYKFLNGIRMMSDMAIRFDTLKIVERLERGGFTREQAKTQAEVLADVINPDALGFATRQDLQDVRGELRNELHEVEYRLVARITTVEHKLENFQKATEGKFNLLYWMMGFMLTMMSGLFYKLVIL